MNNLIHFLDGKFVTEDELVISPRDLGVARGYAVADFLVTHNLKPFKLTEHVERLFKSADVIGLKMPWSKEQISDWIKETLDRNDKSIEKTIKIIVTGGKSKTLYPAKIPTLIIMISPYNPKPFDSYKLKIKTIKYKRPYPEAKTTHYIESVRQRSISETDFDEIIYYDDSQVFEGAGSNLFAVIDNTLVTTKSNIVEGVTRNILLEILDLPVPIEVRDFTYDELLNATEIFLTGSAKGVRAVIKLNEKSVGNGEIGKVTKEVAQQYQDYILKTTGKQF